VLKPIASILSKTKEEINIKTEAKVIKRFPIAIKIGSISKIIADVIVGIKTKNKRRKKVFLLEFINLKKDNILNK
jgi:hypothetical protein